MALSNAERVSKALDLVMIGLRPFVEQELRACYGDDWLAPVRAELKDGRLTQFDEAEPHLDLAVLISVLIGQWNEVFRTILGPAERALAHELRDVRNRWAHQEAFSTDDAYRALDTAHRFLTAINAADPAAEVDRQKQELLRVRFDEQARRETRRAATAALAGQPSGGLKPWREVVTPHPDVASGRYQLAEFMADLQQVVGGQASAEYADPVEFFRRTYLTQGLRRLLTGALKRVNRADGEPVVELQTNFGGGKTHSMLALYHLLGPVSAADLPGVEPLLAEGGPQPAGVRRAVLVGQALSPGQARRQADGTITRTLWGELAWQLLGRAGYDFVAGADEAGVSPGSAALTDLLRQAAPCLILIDEWVAYVRQFYGKPHMVGGSFDAILTFAQALTEAVRAVPGALLVASLPASDREAGGEGGVEALARLRHVFARVQSPWRPATAEESFEIVRRRLFQPLTDPQLFKARDAVVKAFGDLYRDQAAEFPAECHEADYERRMTAAYPIHPELFERLYSDWSSLDKFQRTRGVLRLMAKVIQTLWEQQDAGLLILPANVPVAEHDVSEEMLVYLEDSWRPVLDADVDGPHSLPLRVDREQPNLGRYSACRRVARSVFVGSAPTLHAASRGIDDVRVKLGCTQPGESPAIFGDALRRLTDQATYLYVHAARYWYSTQASVTRLAQERAARYPLEEVWDHLRGVLRDDRSQGGFHRVHRCPASHSEVSDDEEARLVILAPEHPHSANQTDSPACLQVAAMLEHRGNSPRYHKNALVFLAADRQRLADLEQAVRQAMAWASIVTDYQRDNLTLDNFQASQARQKQQDAEQTVTQRIPEAYHWLVVPCQETPLTPSTVEAYRLQGAGSLADRATRRCGSEELLLPRYAGSRLRLKLDNVPLWQGDHVPVRQLWTYFTQYLYLPRLATMEVLIDAVMDGVASLAWAQEGFAFADSYDPSSGRYGGLRAGCQVKLSAVADGLVVKPAAAQRQIEADARPADRPDPPVRIVGTTDTTEIDGKTVTVTEIEQVVVPVQRTRFYGTVKLDPTRAGADASQIAQEVISHLQALPGAKVEVTLEIAATIADGTPDQVVRTVEENCRTLRFKQQGFEEQ